MIAERPDIGACTCTAATPDPCRWDRELGEWVGPCWPKRNTVHLIPCVDAACPAHATPAGRVFPVHHHECKAPCDEPRCQHFRAVPTTFGGSS